MVENPSRYPQLTKDLCEYLQKVQSGHVLASSELVDLLIRTRQFIEQVQTKVEILEVTRKKDDEELANLKTELSRVKELVIEITRDKK